MERREYSVRCRVGIWSLPKSLLMLQKGSNIAQNDPEKILLTIHDVLRRFVKNGTPKGGRRVYRAFQNPYFCSKKTQIRLKMIHARYSWRSMMSSDNFFFEIGVYWSLIFSYQSKIVLCKVAGGYIEPSKIHTNTPKRLNMA